MMNTELQQFSWPSVLLLSHMHTPSCGWRRRRFCDEPSHTSETIRYWRQRQSLDTDGLRPCFISLLPTSGYSWRPCSPWVLARFTLDIFLRTVYSLI